MKREVFVGLTFVTSALSVMVISGLTLASLPIPREVGKPAGEIIFVVGMAAFIWTASCLKESFQGTVAPVSDQLTQNGPYRRIRHPLYLSMVIILVGITLAFRSIWGLVGVFVLFLPAAVYRAKLEEEALALRFGQEWAAYAAQTSFLIPWVW
jgi:protein-S-isoprenylcysteine O-methyltransferase Ste14